MSRAAAMLGVVFGLVASCAVVPVSPPPGIALAQPTLAQDARAALADISRYAVEALQTPDGRIRCEYDLITGEWSDYEVHWHTGQLIWGLVEAASVLDEPGLLAAARRSGDWWVSTQFVAPHPFAGLVNAAHGDKLGDLLNWTTISDGTPGLFALSRATGDPIYADAATQSGQWLWANTRVPDTVAGGEGLFYNIFDAHRGVVVTDWNPHTQGPAYDPAEAARLGPPPVTELARPNIEGFLFQDMCRHTGKTLWCDRFLEQAEFALSRQDTKGLWMAFEPNDARTGNVHPRFNIWNAEALLQAYEVSGNRRFLEGAAATARFYRDISRPDGTIHYTLNVNGTSRPDAMIGSAVAFNGILMLRLRDYGYTEFDAAIDRAARWIIANRFDPDLPDANLAGAVINTRYRQRDGRISLVNRDVGTTFAMRFLALWLRDAAGEDVNIHLNAPGGTP